MGDLPARKNVSLEPAPDQLGSEEGLAIKLEDTESENIDLGDIKPSDRYKNVLRESIKVAREYNKKYVGPEHILLGFFRESRNLAAAILHDLGIHEGSLKAIIEEELMPCTANDTLQDQVEYSLIQVGYGEGIPEPTDLFWRMFKVAQDYASEMDHKIVGPEHILYALAVMEDSNVIPYDILHRFKVTAADVKRELNHMLGLPENPVHVYLFKLIHQYGKVEDVYILAETWPLAVKQVKKRKYSNLIPYDPKLSREELELAMEKPDEYKVSPVDEIAGFKIKTADIDEIVLHTR